MTSAAFPPNNKESLTPILLNLVQQSKEEGTLPHSLYESIIIMITKLVKINAKKKNMEHSLMNRGAKILDKILAN